MNHFSEIAEILRSLVVLCKYVVAYIEPKINDLAFRLLHQIRICRLS